MTSNPSTFSQIGVEAMNGGYFMAGSGGGGGGMMSTDVPYFHPSMLLEHGGFGFGLGGAAIGGAATATDLGAQFAANNVILASFASQLFATAPAPPQDDHLGARTPPGEDMDDGYGAADVGSCSVACLACPGQSGAMAVWSSSSSKKPYGSWSSVDGSSTVSVHGSCHLAELPDAACVHYPLTACGSANAPAASELSLTLCPKSSSDGMLNATDQCSSVASRSALTELPPVYPRARSRSAHFAVVVARSPYAAVAQEVLNDVVGRLLNGVADLAADSDSGPWQSSGSVGAPSAVSSNQLIACSGEHPHGGDAGPRWGEAQRIRSDLIKMLQLIDQKYNQCLDEIQSTMAKFSTLTQSGGAGIGNGSICAPFAHRALSAMYRGLRRRIAGEIMAAASRPACLGESSSSVTAGDMERSWEAAFIQKHWAVQQLRPGEQQCWRPQRGLPEKSVAVLKAWMFENFLKPYPNDHDKDVLAARSGLTRNQVSNWFINARVRIWKPMIEEMYQDLKRSSAGGGQGVAMEQHMSSQDLVG
ncbi:homeobox protein ATH1-like [Phragmites australis]|uniref:homeobox protein ATH1-like n=1 Tax=Phragmites australis TaxID=29695 RepID=UPI002D79835E|nr:homeobox protein ATH1-like [Phragmites australis]XP_062217303.1 homeobox protein ATH1-like [Phragmites australis]XP_062217304.1 homeobox protein ATH1-like [Phragmites australis]